jgi:hypothetical protein
VKVFSQTAKVNRLFPHESMVTSSSTSNGLRRRAAERTALRILFDKPGFLSHRFFNLAAQDNITVPLNDVLQSILRFV